MRTLLIGALAVSVAGCSNHLPPQPVVVSDANKVACFKRSAAGRPIEPGTVPFKTGSAITKTNFDTTATTKKRSSAHACESTHRGRKAAKATIVARKLGPPASRIALSPRSLDPRLSASNAAADSHAALANISDSHPVGDDVANSNTRTIQEQVAAAMAVAERITVATLVPALDHPETPLQGSAERIALAQSNKMDPLVYLLIARPDIKSVSDLTGKIVAIDDAHPGFDANVGIAIAAAGAPEVQLSNTQTKAIDRVINGEVAAAVLTAVSPEAAEGFPDIRGYKIFRIPLSPHH